MRLMGSVLILDSTPLSLLAHPDVKQPGVLEIRAWLEAHLQRGSTIYLPEIADYELRRELIRANKLRSLRRLDYLPQEVLYLPLDTPTVRRAAELWAKARNAGHLTASADALDADVLLAAQAESVGATIVTANVAHLAFFGQAERWQNLPPPPPSES